MRADHPHRKPQRLFDSFEPYDQTRLELKIGAAPAEMSGKTSGKTSAKMSGKTPDRILTLLRSAPNLAIPDIAAVLGKTERTVERVIRDLKSTGRLERAGSARGGQWIVRESD